MLDGIRWSSGPRRSVCQVALWGRKWNTWDFWGSAWTRSPARAPSISGHLLAFCGGQSEGKRFSLWLSSWIIWASRGFIIAYVCSALSSSPIRIGEAGALGFSLHHTCNYLNYVTICCQRSTFSCNHHTINNWHVQMIRSSCTACLFTEEIETYFGLERLPGFQGQNVELLNVLNIFSLFKCDGYVCLSMKCIVSRDPRIDFAQFTRSWLFTSLQYDPAQDQERSSCTRALEGFCRSSSTLWQDEEDGHSWRPEVSVYHSTIILQQVLFSHM